MNKLAVFILSIVFLIACEKNSTGSFDSNESVTLSVQYVNTNVASGSLAKASGTTDVTGIQVTRARFLIRNVRLKTIKEDSIEFKSEPMVVDLDLDGGVNTLHVSEVPPGRYDRLEFRVQRLDDDDPRERAYFSHPDFIDFVQDNRYSIIIEGVVSENNNDPEPFVFRSRDNEKQRHFLNPAIDVGNGSGSLDVRLQINGSNWFRGSNGKLLDPRDKRVEDEISENLSRSIAAFSDSKRSSSDDDKGGY